MFNSTWAATRPDQDPNTVYGGVEGMGTVQYSGVNTWTQVQATPLPAGTLGGGPVIVNQATPTTITTAPLFVPPELFSSFFSTVNQVTTSVNGGKTFATTRDRDQSSGRPGRHPRAPPPLVADPTNPSHLLFGTINA